MLIPEFLLGTSTEVKRRARRFLRDVQRGVAESDPLVDSQETDALIVIDASRVYSGMRNFQVYIPLEIATDDVPRKDEALLKLYDWLLKSPWGVLALMGQNVNFVRLDEPRAIAFLRAGLVHWPIAALRARLPNDDHRGLLEGHATDFVDVLSHARSE
jgi:hypothetical protein